MCSRCFVKLAQRVPAGPGILRERTATRVKCPLETHQTIDPADHRSGDVPDDPAEHPRRHLPRQCSLRSSKQQADVIAVRPDQADLVHNGGGRK